jgi:hypothetical protein
MTNMTIAIPEEIRTSMNNFNEIKWSHVARKAIMEKVKTLELAEKLAKKSKLTQKDVDEFDAFIKSKANKRFSL